MPRNLLCAAIISAALGLSPAAASEPDNLGWAELVDAEAQVFEDPYRDIAPDQLSTLVSLARLQKQLQSDSMDDAVRPRIEARIGQKRVELEAAGIDADWLIAQRRVVAERRERAATAGNLAVDGQIVSLAGFAIPAPPEPDGTRVAYLVPERGMCSHMPPPNPNQMIRVRLPDDWAPRYIHEPVRVTGRLDIAPSEQVMLVVDGMVSMRATFQMDVRHVETVKDMRPLGGQARTNAWAEGITKRFLAKNVKPNQ